MIKYNCKENDNYLNLYFELDGLELSELHIGTVLPSDGRMIITFDDLKTALAEAGYSVTFEGLR